jgi:hypothetical protein
MIQALVLLGTAALAALVWWVVRRASSRVATGGRLAGIAAPLAAQAILLDTFTLGVFPALWSGGRGRPWA